MSLSVDENGGSSSEDGKNCSRGHWRPAEDDKLKQLVEQFGPRNWNSIAEHIEGRTGNQTNNAFRKFSSPSEIKFSHSSFIITINNSRNKLSFFCETSSPTTHYFFWLPKLYNLC